MLPHLPGVEGMLQGLDAHGKPPPLRTVQILPPPVPSSSRPPLQHTHSDSSLRHILDLPSPPRPESSHGVDRSASTSFGSRTPRTFVHRSPSTPHSVPLYPSSLLSRLHTERERPTDTVVERGGSPSQAQSPWSSEESAFSDDIDMATEVSPLPDFAALPAQLQATSSAEYQARMRRLTCQYCHKTFRRPSTLRTHENVHTRELEFWCTFPGCGKTYNVRGNAYRHVRRAHDVVSMLDARKYVVTAGNRPDTTQRRNSLPG
ncbi:hypothetical protein EXIGLDRAFT_834188 [Exidia glandulosa HHB12029]|uniref:C2H2-type domain-containing protein n=1 Tax=Exidia glandulosa HHB12029 TaxID=1314781 RepID=A0A165HVI5_EXIGL|nr:hypothetical protein EXIGLDRAFT_836424 [Exidia glandulosa HHB12029]KZV95585.1 hypothetical protein EXIGLDRAFT_834188 [Exidia glandulosa HHB12029]